MLFFLPFLAFLRGSEAHDLPTVDGEIVHSLARRDVCDGVNAKPVLYTEYHTDSCPPVLSLNPDGTCPGLDAEKNSCVAFCQIRTEFQYTTEIPIQDSYCYGPMTCTYTDTITKTVTVSYNLDLNWAKGLNFGVSGGYSIADANATAFANAVTLGADQCGYFTVIPIWKYVCGTVTDADLVTFFYVYCDSKTRTYGNICISGPRMVNGGADNVIVFVYTDCVTQQPLGPESQNPAYNQPGVPLDRGLYATMASGWAQIPPGGTAFTQSRPICGALGYNMAAADVAQCVSFLADAGTESCCSNGAGGPKDICVMNGNTVKLLGEDDLGNPVCADCNRISNYLSGIESECNSNGMIGGDVVVTGTSAMLLQV